MKPFSVLSHRLSQLKERVIDIGFFPETRHQTLIKRHLSRRLIQSYSGDDGQNVNYTQYFLGFGLIHYALIRNLKPKHVLCVGSRKGFIPAILALACKDNGCGQVDFVDAAYDEDTPEKNWSGIGFWKKIIPSAHFAKIHVEKYISTYVMTTAEFAKRYPNRKYQYIYIDGDHSYEGVKLDYALFWPRLTRGGIMAFHDVIARGYLNKGLFGIWKFWKETTNRHSIIFPFPKSSGLGILQKP